MPGASCRALAEGIRHRRDASPAVLMCRLFSLDYLMEHATCLGFAPRARCEGRPKPGPRGRVSTSKRPMRRVEPERPRLRRTGLSAAPKAGEPAYPLGPRFAGPRQGLAGGCAPSGPPERQRHVMSAGRAVWVKIRASEAERAEWHAKARSAGLTLSDLVRRSVGRVRTWTVPHADVERERTRELARIGSGLSVV